LNIELLTLSVEEGEDEVKQGAILGTARLGDFLFYKELW
jgi:hypothetical protein